MAEREDMRADIALFSIKVTKLREDAVRIGPKLPSEERKNWDSIAGELEWIQGRLIDDASRRKASQGPR